MFWGCCFFQSCEHNKGKFPGPLSLWGEGTNPKARFFKTLTQKYFSWLHAAGTKREKCAVCLWLYPSPIYLQFADVADVLEEIMGQNKCA